MDTSARPLPAATSNRRGAGLALVLAGSASNQAGAALGALAFPVIGPVGVVAVRQLVTALVLVPAVRPRLRELGGAQWWPVLGLASTFSVMNLGLYTAVERIGLGPAVTLEFLGPLAVALAGSRRALDLLCALTAAAGVVLLTHPGPATDVVGVVAALLAACAWAAYILLNRTVGRRLPGLRGTAAASAVSAAVWTPVALVWFAFHTPTSAALALAACCAVMSSVVAYAVDLIALRRVPAALFGTLTSINPVWAALVGRLVLHQPLAVGEGVGIALIVLGNAVASAGGRTRARRS